MKGRTSLTVPVTVTPPIRWAASRSRSVGFRPTVNVVSGTCARIAGRIDSMKYRTRVSFGCQSIDPLNTRCAGRWRCGCGGVVARVHVGRIDAALIPGASRSSRRRSSADTAMVRSARRQASASARGASATQFEERANPRPPLQRGEALQIDTRRCVQRGRRAQNRPWERSSRRRENRRRRDRRRRR